MIFWGMACVEYFTPLGLCSSIPLKPIGGKSGALRASLSAAPPILLLAATVPHEVVRLVELPVGIPRPKIVSPATGVSSARLGLSKN
jgi:hypothetical protein